LIYTWNESSYLEAYHFNGSTFDTTPVLTGAVQADMAGGIVTLSANSGDPNTGIIWASMPLSGSPGNAVVPGIVRALNAVTLDEIWNSQQVASRDSVGTYAKFVPPFVVNGKVYMATFNNAVVVYGLLPADARAFPKQKIAAAEEIRKSGQN
jgi:outer membrane protein assembly factor BamB